MERVQLALIGCGGMGRRHLEGLVELSNSSLANVELVAVCDSARSLADEAADEAERRLGRRPRVFGDVTAMLREIESLEAADITTTVSTHHQLAVECLERGLAVLVEKPMALTMRACNVIIEAARRTGRPVSVAENIRRDPIARLARALIRDGAIGEPQLMVELHVGGADRMVLSQWRHDKLSGGVTLDVGIHNADMMLFYLGEPAEVYGQTRLYEPIRRRSSEPQWRGGFHRRTLESAPEAFPATAEDALFALIRFTGGALCQWTAHYAGHGEPLSRRVIYGRKGSLGTPGERTGKPLRLVLDGLGELTDEAVLEHAPSYQLDPLSAELFGSARPWSYQMPFVEVDRKLIALEQYELAEAARGRLVPEVDAEAGRSAAAIVYGACEAAIAGRAVSAEEIERVKVDAYQREIDVHLGLLSRE